MSAIGFALMGLAFHFPGAFPPDPGGPGAAPFGALIGAVSGALLGSMQWAVLRRRVRNAGRWIIGTALGIGGVHAVGDAFPDSTLTVPFAVAAGLWVGGAQWLLLRQVLSAPSWIAATAVAWGIGLTLGIAVAGALGLMDLDRASGWAERKAVIGVVLGLISGASTAWLVPTAAPASPDDPNTA